MPAATETDDRYRVQLQRIEAALDHTTDKKMVRLLNKAFWRTWLDAAIEQEISRVDRAMGKAAAK
jgi:hypothetical protein